MILFALIILPVGAQNETETVASSDGSAILPIDQAPLDVASSDPLTQTAIDENSGMDYLYSLQAESESSDQPEGSGAISEEPINNLENLENSIALSDSSSKETNPQDIAGDGGSALETDSGQASSEEELKRTMLDIDQSEAGFPLIPDEGTSQTDQVSLPDTGSILNIFGQHDDNFMSKDDASSGENIIDSSDIVKDISGMRSVWVDRSEKATLSGHARPSVLNQGLESQGNGEMAIRDQYSRSLSNLEIITKFADGKDVTDKNLEEVLLGMNSQFDVLQNPDPKKAEYLTVLPYWGPLVAPSDHISIETSYIADLTIDDEDNKPKNYAVVVGINQYSDRRSLHTSVNDAEEMARVLKEFYGYEVILLTDKTKDLPPTKHNILEGALAEIKLKKNKGDVLVYFSGHGEVDDKGNFYLIPQDAKSNPDSYISEDELNQYTKDIRGLSLVVDACYSGGLYKKDQKIYSDSQGMEDGKGAKQLILSSSREDEPSNEMWNETNSVFTYYLCHAMEDEAKKSSGIPMQSSMQSSLQSCFSSVHDSTVSWSSSHFLSQTPHLTLA